MPVEQDYAAKDPVLGPVATLNAVSDAFGVWVVVAIPRVAKESCRKCHRVTKIPSLHVLRGEPSTERIFFMPVRILLVDWSVTAI
jgi:hypothetical protein